MWFNILECILPGKQFKQTAVGKKQDRESAVKKQNDAESLLNLTLFSTSYSYIQLTPPFKEKSNLDLSLKKIKTAGIRALPGSNTVSSCILLNFRTRSDQVSFLCVEQKAPAKCPVTDYL